LLPRHNRALARFIAKTCLRFRGPLRAYCTYSNQAGRGYPDDDSILMKNAISLRYLPDLHNRPYARRGGVDCIFIVQASKQYNNQATLRESTHNKYYNTTVSNASPEVLNASLGSTRQMFIISMLDHVIS
jgi:hypothetical protein